MPIFISILDRKNKALYSRVLVDEKVKASIPKPRTLQPLTGRNGLDSHEMVLLDSRTIVIKDFSFKGRAPDTHFLVGIAGTIPNDIDGFIIPNDKGDDEPLGRKDVLISHLSNYYSRSLVLLVGQLYLKGS